MGVSVSNETPDFGKPTFSEDVFKVELFGPGRDNLSIVDIPGIFREPDDKINTTKKDIEMVRKMVHNWIRDERTIILAVININIDVATTEILSVSRMKMLSLGVKHTNIILDSA